MNIKLFGKEIFSFKKDKGGTIIFNSLENVKNSKFLPDFYTMRENKDTGNFIELFDNSTTSINGQIKKHNKKVAKEKEITPKEVYNLKLINEDNFSINTNKDYIDKEIKSFKDKLDLITINEYDVSRGSNEIASVIMRLENRKKYNSFNSFFDDYAYTTTTKIKEVISNHSNLQLGKVDQFIADMPTEAIEEMKNYTKQTESLCKKKPIFYIIADKKDFKITDQRRDPILLAQSPFGHFWQVIGAWDQEMMFLEEL